MEKTVERQAIHLLIADRANTASLDIHGILQNMQTLGYQLTSLLF
jgi:hypothetical protein